MTEIYIILMMIAVILSLEYCIKVFNSSSIHYQPIATPHCQQAVAARQAVAVISNLIMEESPNSFPKRL
jgi:hypothetical protein